MRTLLALLLALHGSIHILGFVKAFGLADVPQLQREIGPGVGLLWLAAAVLFVVAAALLMTAPRSWWLAAVPGVLLSQALIVGAWSDARFGTLANALILVPLLVAAADLRPSSLRSMFRTEVERELRRHVARESVLTEADLAPLPDPIQAWLGRVGVVGRPRVRSLHAVFRARFRGEADAPWMTGTAEQYGFFGPPARLFFMKVHRAGLPVQVFHRYVGSAATFEARLLGLVAVVDASGPELTQSETVTLLNDMFLLAPASLVDAPIEWEVLDHRHVRATFTNAGHRVSAVVEFDEAGDLVDFRSDDRYQTGSDGALRRLQWSTPVTAHADLGGLRLVSEAEARWRETSGEWVYARFVLEDITYVPVSVPAAAAGGPGGTTRGAWPGPEPTDSRGDRSLTDSAGTMVLGTALTDSLGRFDLPPSGPGTCRIRVASIGHSDFQSHPFRGERSGEAMPRRASPPSSSMVRSYVTAATTWSTLRWRRRGRDRPGALERARPPALGRGPPCEAVLTWTR